MVRTFHRVALGVVATAVVSGSLALATAPAMAFPATDAQTDDVFVMPWGGQLYKVDPATGATDGPLSQGAPFSGPPGFEIDSTKDLGYFVSYAEPSRIYTLDLSTGMFEASSIELPARYCRAVDLQPSGTMWVACDNSNTHQYPVLRVDLDAGTAEQVGGSGLFRPTGLATDPITSDLYVHGDNGEAAIVDQATGDWTGLDNIRPDGNCCGSADYMSNGNRVIWGYGSWNLYVQDRSSGVFTSTHVSGSGTGGEGMAVAGATGDPAPPALSGVTVSGDLTTGAALLATPQGLAGNPKPRMTYQWQEQISGTWTDVTGATSATFHPRIAQLGNEVRVVATAAARAYDPIVVTSDSVGPIAEGAPDTPTDVQISAVSGAEVHITWTRGPGTTTGFTATVKQGTTVLGTCDSTEDTCNVTGLPGGITVSASVVARNGAFVSPASASVSVGLPFVAVDAQPDDVFVMPWVGQLYRVDPVSGVTSGPLSEAPPFNGPPGFEIDSTKDLGYFVSYADPSRIYTLDLASGRFDVSSIALPARNCRAVDLQYNGALWAACDYSNTDQNVMVRVDLGAGTAEQVGGSGLFRPTGLATDPVDDTLYVFGDNGEMATVDQDTGTWSDQVNIGSGYISFGSADYMANGDRVTWRSSDSLNIRDHATDAVRSILINGAISGAGEGMAVAGATGSPTPPALSGVTTSGDLPTGSVLLATPVGLGGIPRPHLSYQWQQRVSGSWTDLPGETNRSFTLKVAQIGDLVRVVATASSVGGDPVVVQSDPVGPVLSGAPDAPTGVVATPLSPTTLHVSWSAGAGAISDYFVTASVADRLFTSCSTTELSCDLSGFLGTEQATVTVVARDGSFTSAAATAAPVTMPRGPLDAREGDLFISRWGGGLYQMDPVSGVTRGPLSENAPFNGPPGFDIDATHDVGYFVSYANPTRLYTLDLSTGLFDSQSIELPAQYCRAVDLAPDGVVWVGCDHDGAGSVANVIIKVDTATGSAVQVGGDQGVRPAGLGSDRLTGQLYLMSDNGPMMPIDMQTGVAGAPVPSMPGTSLDFSSAGDAYSYQYAGPLIRRDHATGASSSLAPVGVGGDEGFASANDVTPGGLAPVFIATSPQLEGRAQDVYASYTFEASAWPRAAFSVNGTLPDGLTLNSATGVLSGTPTTQGDYTFSVTADNGVGTPATTGDITITVADAIPAVPEGVTASQVELSKNIDVSWLSATNATSYVATLKQGGGTVGTCSTSAALTCRVTAPGYGSYSVTVQAINGAERSAESATVPVTLIQPLPAKPRGVAASQVGTSRNALISWSAASDADSYIVTMKQNGIVVDTCTSSTLSCTVTASAFGSFTVLVLARNGELSSPESGSATGVLVDPTPPAPVGVGGLQVGTSKRLTVTWSAVAGATSYTATLRIRNVVAGSCETATTSCEITATDYGAYTLTVKATRSTFTSVASDAVTGNLIPAPDRLPAPTGLTATPDDGRVSLAWKSVAGAASYKIRQSADGGKTWTQIATNIVGTKYVVANLMNGKGYRFAVGVVGTHDEWSDPESAKPRTVPDPVANLVAAGAKGQVTLRWSEPVNDGGSSIVEFRVTVKGGAYQDWAEVKFVAAKPNVSAYSFTVKGLAAGKYSFRVAASNAAGRGSTASVASKAL